VDNSWTTSRQFFVATFAMASALAAAASFLTHSASPGGNACSIDSRSRRNSGVVVIPRMKGPARNFAARFSGSGKSSSRRNVSATCRSPVISTVRPSRHTGLMRKQACSARSARGCRSKK
jgi:hypothetical protein